MEGLILHRVKGDAKKTFEFHDLNDFQGACLYETNAVSDMEFLECAFEATNSIDRHWHLNNGVTVQEGDSKRSTSVGDIIWIEEKIYMVKNVGFKLVFDTTK